MTTYCLRNHVSNSLDTGFKIFVLKLQLLNREVVLSSLELLRRMMREHHVKDIATTNRIYNNVSIWTHPDFHSQLIDNLLCNWILTNEIVRQGRPVRTVGGWTLRDDFREKCLANNAVGSINADNQVESV